MKDFIFKERAWSCREVFRERSHTRTVRSTMAITHHPLPQRYENPSWIPRKPHAQKKQNGRNLLFISVASHTQKKKKRAVKKHTSEFNFARRGKALLPQSRIAFWRRRRWNTNPGSGKVVAKSSLLSMWYGIWNTQDQNWLCLQPQRS